MLDDFGQSVKNTKSISSIPRQPQFVLLWGRATLLLKSTIYRQLKCLALSGNQSIQRPGIGIMRSLVMARHQLLIHGGKQKPVDI